MPIRVYFLGGIIDNSVHDVNLLTNERDFGDGDKYLLLVKNPRYSCRFYLSTKLLYLLRDKTKLFELQAETIGKIR